MTPVLAPIQWSLYVAANPAMGKASDGGAHAGLSDLELVNDDVNRHIKPASTPMPPSATTPWQEWRSPGWCGDYAVTKRARLLALGWPSSALRLAEVVTAEGEEHCVLVCACPARGSLVLDNRVDALRAPERTGYKWIRTQSSEDPNLWASGEP